MGLASTAGVTETARTLVPNISACKRFFHSASEQFLITITKFREVLLAYAFELISKELLKWWRASER